MWIDLNYYFNEYHGESMEDTSEVLAAITSAARQLKAITHRDFDSNNPSSKMKLALAMQAEYLLHHPENRDGVGENVKIGSFQGASREGIVILPLVRQLLFDEGLLYRGVSPWK